MLVDVLRGRTEPLQVLPVSDARHQPDAKQERKAIDRRALRLRVAVQDIGLNVRVVLRQPVQDVDRLPHAAGYEVAEQRDVSVRDMVVDAALPGA